jgi:Domain of unknown function (DUF3885)
MKSYPQLFEYLDQTFHELELGGGLFYRWPISLRFEVGRGEVPARPAAIYEACFFESDLCTVIAQDWNRNSEGAHEARLRPLFSHLEAFNLNTPIDKVLVEHCDEDGERSAYTLQWVNQPAREFGYKEIFQQISNADLGVAPAICSRVYFLNKRNGILLHMYDDRGLDVIGAKRESIVDPYRQFSEWILDYDRKRVEEMFA